MNAPVIRISGALLLLFSLSGCAQNQALSPLTDGEQVIIAVKVPLNLAAEPMRVMYRSAQCAIKRSGPDWTTYEEDGYLSTTVQLQQQGKSDLFEAKLPINDAGRCKWQLSNVTIGVSYASTAHLGEGVRAAPGVGVIVMFDQHLPQRRSAFQPTMNLDGDVVIKKDYYPWINEQFIGKHEKLVRLFGEGERYFYYRSVTARKVLFEPILYAKYMLYSSEPKVQGGGDSRDVYPDGSVVVDGRDPNFMKLQAIRLSAEKTQ